MIQYLLTFAMATLLLGSLSFAKNESQQSPTCKKTEYWETKPKHFIFLVHGLAGNTETFGIMGEALIKDLSQINPCFDYIYHNVSYETGHQSKDSYDFIHELGRQIEVKVANSGDLIRRHDKISLIAHSQGGIVSSLWYHRSVTEDLEGWSRYAEKVDSLITVGTPFWGSKIAYFGFNTWKTIPVLGSLFTKANMGLGELEALSHGSQITNNFHQSAIQLDQTEKLHDVFNFRPLSIAGVTSRSNSPKLSQWKKFSLTESPMQWTKKFLRWWTVNAAERKGFGGLRYESDIAVLVPSARPNFYYMQDLSNSNKKIQPSDFKMTSFSKTGEEVPFKILETIHASPWADRIYDMVAIPKLCLDPKLCDHPTYPLVLEHISNCQERVNECNLNKHDELLETMITNTEKRFIGYRDVDLTQEMRGFLLELNLRLPTGYNISQLKKLNEDSIFDYIKFSRKTVEQTIAHLGENKDSDHLKKIRNRPLAENNSTYEIYIGRDREKLSAGSNISNEENSQELRIHLTGIVVPEIHGKLSLEEASHKIEQFKEKLKTGFPIQLTVHLPGLESREVEALVRPSYATYADFNLNKE